MQAASGLDGVRVLVVDDEPDALDLIAEVLRRAGAIVETARSAAEGFGSFMRTPPDVLVSDIGMPDEDGFGFMRRVRELPKTEGGAVPSLALTAFAREEDRARAIAAGYTTHIGKPVDPAALASAVAHLATAVNGP
jgi:CheY-like chemotaxis protein